MRCHGMVQVRYTTWFGPFTITQPWASGPQYVNLAPRHIKDIYVYVTKIRLRENLSLFTANRTICLSYASSSVQ
jgi:hypothetical protein